MPHRIDCGFRKTVRESVDACFSIHRRSARFVRVWQQKQEQRADSEAGNAHPDPKAVPRRHRRSAVRRRTARPNRRPCRTSASRRSASRPATAGSSSSRCRPRRPSANTPPAPCRSRPMLADLAVAGREQQAPMPTTAAPIGTTRPRAQAVHRHAGDEAERRVAVVEKAHHRRHPERAEAERLRQLRHHHRRCRAQRLLVEVIDRRDQPRDRGGLDASACVRTRLSRHTYKLHTVPAIDPVAPSRMGNL